MQHACIGRCAVSEQHACSACLRAVSALASGNRLISFLNEVELAVCNGREFTVEPQWTRARPSLKQKSIIGYIVTDSNLLQVLQDSIA